MEGDKYPAISFVLSMVCPLKTGKLNDRENPAINAAATDMGFDLDQR